MKDVVKRPPVPRYRIFKSDGSYNLRGYFMFNKRTKKWEKHPRNTELDYTYTLSEVKQMMREQNFLNHPYIFYKDLDKDIIVDVFKKHFLACKIRNHLDE